MAIEFHCPHCQKYLKTKDDKAGSEAKCPGCGEPITVPAAEEVNPYAVESTNEFYEEPSDGTVICPACGEANAAYEAECAHCGADIEGARVSEGIQPTLISAGDVLNDTWAIYKNQMGLCIGAVLVTWLISMLAGAPGNILNVLLQNGAFPQDALPIFFFLHFVFVIVSMVAQMFIAVGLNIFWLKIVRGQQAQIGDLFTGGSFLLRMLGNSILFGLMLMVGFLACIVPGILLMLMFWPYAFLLVDQNPGGMGCLTRCQEFTKGNWGAVFVLALASMGINILGLLACLVGLLFTAPFCMLMFAVAYVHMTGGGARRRTAL